MYQSNQAEDFTILDVKTDIEIPIKKDIIKFNENNKIIEKKSFSKILYYFLKRTVDIVASSTLLILLSPVFLVTSLIIRKDSKGPALLKQKRIGKNGNLFTIYKFRTMFLGADDKLKELIEKDEKVREEYSINKKLKNDPRITKVGKFLRKTSIDELPQLMNVLKGEMSLVGPRPYLPREIEDMGEHYEKIVVSKPGITGLWQVSGRSNTTFEERLEFDEEYVKNKGFSYDMGLLFKTVGAVVCKNGAE